MHQIKKDRIAAPRLEQDRIVGSIRDLSTQISNTVTQYSNFREMYEHNIAEWRLKTLEQEVSRMVSLVEELKDIDFRIHPK